MSNRFEGFNSISEEFEHRLNVPTLRVKIWKWFTPIATEDEGNKLLFNARQVASRWGNRDIKALLNEDPDAQLALVADLGGKYYKSSIGLLAVHNSIEPVRLETFNTDGDTGLPMVQHALIDTREIADVVNVKFR